jgi:hypothetical protein
MHIHPLRLVVAGSAVCAAMACGTFVPPTGPSLPTQLEIRGTTLLMVGGSGRLTAWNVADDPTREVPATWTVEGDAVAVTSGGAVIARRLGLATVRARYQGHAGEGVVQVVDSFAGTWGGSITVVECWQTAPTSPSPCLGRVGLTGPLVLRVTQTATAEHYDNLRASVEVFTPPANGSFVGAVDSSGLFFLDGDVERGADLLGGAVRFRWQIEHDRLVPNTLHVFGNDTIDVSLSMRVGSLLTPFSEIWRLSPMTR